jgi:hypothetical protein
MRRVFAIAVWLAAVQTALAGTALANEAALTLTLSQRERGQLVSSTSQGERGRFSVPTCALEKRLIADATDGRLDEFSPLGAALVAGGVQDDDLLRHYEEKAAALVDELRRSGTVAGTPRQQVEAIFAFMHQHVLRGGY